MSSAVVPTEPDSYSEGGTEHEEARTPIGVDVGEKRLVTAATPSAPPEDAFVIDGAHVRELFEETATMQRRLQRMPFTTLGAQRELFATTWIELRGLLLGAASQTVAHAQEFDTPVLVLEDLQDRSVTLWEWRDARGELGTWLLPTLQEALRQRAQAAGVPVVEVSPMHSSQECHACGERGELGRETLQCSTPSCPVEEVCRDWSAAVTIATRAWA